MAVLKKTGFAPLEKVSKQRGPEARILGLGPPSDETLGLLILFPFLGSGGHFHST